MRRNFAFTVPNDTVRFECDAGGGAVLPANDDVSTSSRCSCTSSGASNSTFSLIEVGDNDKGSDADDGARDGDSGEFKSNDADDDDGGDGEGDRDDNDENAMEDMPLE